MRLELELVAALCLVVLAAAHIEERVGRVVVCLGWLDVPLRRGEFG